MTQANQQIDAIVREVLRRLQAELPPQTTTPADDNAPQSPPVGENAAAARTALHVDAQVVSTEVLAGRLSGVRQVTVRPGAVITPAARDLLHDADIAWNRTEADGKAERTPLVLAVAAAQFDPSELVRLLGQGRPVQRLAQTGLATTADELGLAVARSGNLGVLLTSQPALAACLLNRRRGVRAAEAHSQAAVDTALESLGANTLVIDPRGKSTHNIRRMVETLCRTARACPAEYRDQLA